MDEQLAKQMVRQLKILNLWISIFGVLILSALMVLGFFVFKIVTFVNDTNSKIENLTVQTKETLDLKSRICESDSVGSFLRDQTETCKEQ